MEGVTFYGPLFDGRAQAAATAGTDAIRRGLAEAAKNLVVAAFEGQIKDNQGEFLGSITTTSHSRTYSTNSGHKTYSMPVVVPDMATDTVVTTELASYGPWLEGTGSRNETTRFKGYHGFRMAAQELDRMAEPYAEREFLPYAGRME